VKPGITGWAQLLSYGSSRDTVEKLQYDLYYIRTQLAVRSCDSHATVSGVVGQGSKVSVARVLRQRNGQCSMAGHALVADDLANDRALQCP
jgi:hypothetical protein